ncbi:MAG: M42 family metallopeptidase [Lachnospiraceae bacterium]|nr:M42 family metallopeptidase [Lachnospiraceae bacterium]
MSLREHLKDLCLLPAPSGYEQEAGRYLKRFYEEIADEVRTDVSGNVIAKFACGKKDARRVMVFAHMDQLGLVVRDVEPDGFLRVERLGGIPEKVLPALQVLVRTEAGAWIPGIIGNKSHHITAPEEKYVVTPVKQMSVDIGASSAEEVHALGIEVGCPVVYRPHFEELGEHRCAGTSLDNRGGCAAIMEVGEHLAQKHPEHYDVYLVATVQEEYNLRGGLVAAQQVRPDWAVCLDIVLTGDTPQTRGMLPVKLGGGPAVGMYNFHGRGTLNGTLPHPLLFEKTVEAAGKLDIPVQRFVSTGILTDASYVQLVEQGVATIDLGFPCRYSHSPVETVDLRDLAQLAALVEEMVREMPAGAVFERCYE